MLTELRLPSFDKYRTVTTVSLLNYARFYVIFNFLCLHLLSFYMFRCVCVCVCVCVCFMVICVCVLWALSPEINLI